jgi:hypothetical protein
MTNKGAKIYGELSRSQNPEGISCGVDAKET